MEPVFAYRNGELHCEDLPVGLVAERYGTPTYVYSTRSLLQRFESTRSAFAPWNPLVCFSVKACSNLSILRLLAQVGSGFDVVSGGELYRALLAGADAGKVVFAGVGKSPEEIDYALQEGIFMFNVESRPELEAICDAAERLGRTAQVALRINPDVDARTHRKTTTGKGETKFGIGMAEAEKLGAETLGWRSVQVHGLHLHLGSPIYSADPYVEAVGKLQGLIERLRRLGCPIERLNLGGGYCVSYTGEEVIEPWGYAEALKSCLEKSGCAVIIEPGRYIAGSSGALLTRVLYRKENEYGKRFAICDAGMNDLIRPTLYGAFQRIWPVKAAEGMPKIIRAGDVAFEGVETELVDVVGPVCETGDFLATEYPLPAVAGGDVLAVFDSGAYCFSMSSNYNARPRAAEVLVDGDRSRLIRRRETYADLVAAEEEYLDVD